MTSHRFNTPPFHFCGNYGQVGHTQTYRHTHTSVTMWSNSRLPAKALHTFVLVQEVRDVEARDGLTVSQRTYSEEEVIYSRVCQRVQRQEAVVEIRPCSPIIT